MKTKLWLALTAGGLLIAGSSYAHHSFAATYREDQVIKIEGEVVQILFRNPHSFVHVSGPDENGVTQRWAVEWGAATILNGQGVGRDTLKPGDHVVIRGNPARNAEEHRVRMRTLLRPSDGFKWGGNASESFN